MKPVCIASLHSYFGSCSHGFKLLIQQAGYYYDILFCCFIGLTLFVWMEARYFLVSILFAVQSETDRDNAVLAVVPLVRRSTGFS